MSKDGLFVVCHGWAPKAKNHEKTVSRASCVAQPHEFCPSCPNSRFVLHVPLGIGHQTIACPRWKNGSSSPDSYVEMRRELCLTQRPFPFCSTCPNKDPREPPRSEEGWYDKEKEWKKKIRSKD